MACVDLGRLLALEVVKDSTSSLPVLSIKGTGQLEVSSQGTEKGQRCCPLAPHGSHFRLLRPTNPSASSAFPAAAQRRGREKGGESSRRGRRRGGAGEHADHRAATTLPVCCKQS